MIDRETLVWIPLVVFLILAAIGFIYMLNPVGDRRR